MRCAVQAAFRGSKQARTLSSSSSRHYQLFSTFSPVLLDVLVCPLSKEKMTVEDGAFQCTEIGVAYPIAKIAVDGANGSAVQYIPVLMPSHGRVLSQLH